MNTIISLYDYKIDFNTNLGIGTVGAVYNVVKRPENEKNILSYLFPYFYDHIFRVSSKYEQTNYCIKILNSDDFALYKIIFEPRVQMNSNRILIENNLSTIEYFKSNSLFSYFKTKITGQTLCNIKLYEKEGFKIRSSWIKFSKLIINSNLKFNDLKPDNIMYDIIKEKFEIIDGSVEKLNEGKNLNNPYDYIETRFLKNINAFVVEELNNFVFTSDCYLKQNDDELLRKLELQFKEKLFSLKNKSHSKDEKYEKRKKEFSEYKIKNILKQQISINIISAIIVSCVSLMIFLIFKSEKVSLE